MLELRGKLRRVVVRLHDERAQAGDKKIVAEHRGDRDEQADDRGNQRAGHTRRHGREIRSSGNGDAGERVHHTPHRAEQPEKWRSAHRRGQNDHLRLHAQARLTHRPLHRHGHRAHLRGRNFVRHLDARGKSVVHFLRAEHLQGQLRTARAVNIVSRRALEGQTRFVNVERLPVPPEYREKALGLLAREADHAELGDDDRPTEDRGKEQRGDDGMPGDGRLLEREIQTVGSEKFRQEDVHHALVVPY